MGKQARKERGCKRLFHTALRHIAARPQKGAAGSSVLSLASQPQADALCHCRAGRPSAGPQCWVAITSPAYARQLMQRFPLHVGGKYNPQVGLAAPGWRSNWAMTVRVLGAGRWALACAALVKAFLLTWLGPSWVRLASAAQQHWRRPRIFIH